MFIIFMDPWERNGHPPLWVYDDVCKLDNTFKMKGPLSFQIKNSKFRQASKILTFIHAKRLKIRFSKLNEQLKNAFLTHHIFCLFLATYCKSFDLLDASFCFTFYPTNTLLAFNWVFNAHGPSPQPKEYTEFQP